MRARAKERLPFSVPIQTGGGVSLLVGALSTYRCTWHQVAPAPARWQQPRVVGTGTAAVVPHTPKNTRRTARPTPSSMAPSPRSKTWRGTLVSPSSDLLDRLRTQARDEGLHLALRQCEGTDSVEVVIVFRQPQRAKPDATFPPFPSWTAVSFEQEWPLIKQQWKDEDGVEFFPASCSCHACCRSNEEADPDRSKKRQRKRSRDDTNSAFELVSLRQQLAAANARWQRALPVLQALLAPEALQLLVGDDTSCPQPAAALALPLAVAQPMGGPEPLD